jgi:hypothetical protein
LPRVTRSSFLKKAEETFKMKNGKSGQQNGVFPQVIVTEAFQKLMAGAGDAHPWP